ncbi:hypothetical protein LP419_15130 [Massilia sp. H-1]|nr:hypothetical protein LP419_15130 [Massilia sp. H-1]
MPCRAGPGARGELPRRHRGAGPARRAARRQSGPAALAGQSPPRHGPAAAPGQGHARPGLSTLIATEGYYSPRVAATLDTSGSEPVARIVVDPGQPTIVGEVDLVLKGFSRAGADARPFDAAELRNRWSLLRPGAGSARPTGKRPSAACCAR